MTYDIHFIAHDPEGLLSPEAQRDLLLRASELVVPQPELAGLVLIYERGRDGAKQAGVQGAFLTCESLTLLLLRQATDFWRVLEVCPTDGLLLDPRREDERAGARVGGHVCPTCGRAVTGLEATFPLAPVLAPSYDEQAHSTIVQESQEAWAGIQAHLLALWDEVSMEPLAATVAASRLVETLKNCVQEWSTGSLGFPMEQI